MLRPVLAPPAPGTQASHYAGDSPSLGARLARLRYRHAARRLFRQFAREGVPQVGTVMFGHTHLPDRYVFPGGRVYVNSGDWSGYTDHRTYCVLEPDGTVRGPFQWESYAKAEFGRPVDAPHPARSSPPSPSEGRG